MIMDDPPCTQLLLILILHWVVVDDSCDIQHLLQLEEFSLKFGWSVVDPIPRHPGPPAEKVLGPPKTYLKHQTSGVMTGCLGSPFYLMIYHGKFPLHFERCLNQPPRFSRTSPCLWNFFSGRLGDQDFPFMEWIWGPYLLLVVEPTHPKNMSQYGNLPQIRVKTKHVWNHQPAITEDSICKYTSSNGWTAGFSLKSHPIGVRKIILTKPPISGRQNLQIFQGSYVIKLVVAMSCSISECSGKFMQSLKVGF